MSRRDLVIPDVKLIRLARRRVHDVLTLANSSQRGRSLINLGCSDEPVQRLVNGILPGSYIQPHVHNGNNPKWESFTLLYGGPVGIVTFMEDGRLAGVKSLAEGGVRGPYVIEPNTYHSAIAIGPSGLLEMLDQPHDPETHKKMAPWAPSEDASQREIEAYLGPIRNYVYSRLASRR